MCRVARYGLQRLDNHCLDLVICDSPRCATAWLVEKTGYSFGNKSRAPLANPGVGRAQLARHLTDPTVRLRLTRFSVCSLRWRHCRRDGAA
jgi:hypothetical protein